jgi:uncharacterized protein (TIGR03067 family)
MSHFINDKKVGEAIFSLDPSKKPGTIDFTRTDSSGNRRARYGIYRIEADDLTICLGEKRPSKFDGAGDAILMQLKRATASADDKEVKKEDTTLKGTWIAVRATAQGGGVIPKEVLDRERVTWTFQEGGKAVFSAKEFNNNQDFQYAYRVDLSSSPKAIDFVCEGPERRKGLKSFGIYQLDEGTLTLCVTQAPKATKEDRPRKFDVEKGDFILFKLQRPAKK